MTAGKMRPAGRMRSLIVRRTLATYPSPMLVNVKGPEVIHSPIYNKGMATDMAERDRLGLRGLLPPRIKSLDQQVDRVLRQVRSLPNAVEKNLFLQDLHDRNETLYHKVVLGSAEIKFFIF